VLLLDVMAVVVGGTVGVLMVVSGVALLVVQQAWSDGPKDCWLLRVGVKAGMLDVEQQQMWAWPTASSMVWTGLRRRMTSPFQACVSRCASSLPPWES
jgi:hypothetical protein